MGMRCRRSFSRTVLVAFSFASSFLVSPTGAQNIGWEGAGAGGAVAGGGSAAVQAGIDMLEQGGNAADAAAATIFALSITDHGAFAIGGEVPLIYYEAATGQTKVLSGLGRAPLDPSAINWYMSNGIPTNGDMKAAPVPGAVHLCMTLLELYGTLSFEEVIGPTLNLISGSGEDWYPRLTVTLNKMIATEQATAGTREQKIAAARDRFYGGDIADDLEAWYIAEGGFLRKSDLQAHVTLVEDPVEIDYRGYTVYKADSWTQGPTLSQTLRLLEGFDMQAFGHLSADYIHVATEALKLAFADRDEYYADPLFSAVPMTELLSDAYTNIRRPLIDINDASFDRRPGDPINLLPLAGAPPTVSHTHPPVPDTTTTVVGDRWGNFVVATPSCNVFGDKGDGGVTGVTHGNRLRSLNTAVGHPNVIEAGKRPRITLTPTMVLKDGRPVLGVSVAGGDLQEQTALNVLLNVIEFGMLPADAVREPRFNTDHRENSFNPTSNRQNAFGTAGSLRVNSSIPQSVRNDLSSRGHDLSTTSSAIATPSSILIDRERGIYYAAGDPATGRHSESVPLAPILEARFETGSDGFAYIDDLFRGTSEPAFASGVYDSNDGFNDGALRVDLGGNGEADIVNMSGGFRRTFNLTESGAVVLSFRYNLTQTDDYESDELSQVMMALDGATIDWQGNDYVEQINGNGNGGGSESTGWRVLAVSLGNLTSGSHTLDLGGYNNKKTTDSESTEILIDDVILDFLGGSPPPVPDGTLGTDPLRAERLEDDGSRILIDWDSSCSAPATKLLYGSLGQVASYALDGAFCEILDPQTWDTVPAGDIWFLAVHDNLGGVEGSWGSATAGERNGLLASGTCGSSIKETVATCP